MVLNAIEIIKIIVLGIIEGITEWLPVSSTGHMIIFDEFVNINMTAEFKEMFLIVIQLGAILAVVLLFWHKMWPFSFRKIAQKRYRNEGVLRKDVWTIWFKVVVACVPGTVVTLLFDDYIDEHLHTPLVIAIALIVYGIAFIVIENMNKKREPKVRSLNDITYKTALIIGLFQVLSIIPGTSRSGATIIGALIIGVSRVAAAEFTFFMAVPVMFGYSLLKLIKFGLNFSGEEITALVIGCVTAFLVSVFVIKFLMGYIKKKDFKVFGWYRIVLGVLVLLLLVL